MVSLWGSKKNDDEEEDRPGSPDTRGTSSGPPPARESHPGADERAPLLPREQRQRPRADGFLDPDDPAVSSLLLYSLFAVH